MVGFTHLLELCGELAGSRDTLRQLLKISGLLVLFVALGGVEEGSRLVRGAIFILHVWNGRW